MAQSQNTARTGPNQRTEIMRNLPAPLPVPDQAVANMSESVLAQAQADGVDEIVFTYTKVTKDGPVVTTRTILGTDFTMAGIPCTTTWSVCATTPDGVRTFNLAGMSNLRTVGPFN